MTDMPIQPDPELLAALLNSNDVIKGRPITEAEFAAMAKAFAENPSPETSISSNAMPKASKKTKIDSKTIKEIVFLFVRNASRKLRRSAPRILRFAGAGCLTVVALGVLTIVFYAFFQYLMGISTILAWSVVGGLVAQAILMAAAAVLTLWTKLVS